MKIHPVVTEMFHADGQTDMTKLIFTFSNFKKAPTKTKPRAQRLILITDTTNLSILVSSY